MAAKANFSPTLEVADVALIEPDIPKVVRPVLMLKLPVASEPFALVITTDPECCAELAPLVRRTAPALPSADAPAATTMSPPVSSPARLMATVHFHSHH